MSALKHARFLLASSSPRRHELLATLGLTFDVEHYDTDESIREGTAPEDAVRDLAERKYRSVPDPTRYDYVLTADTIVIAPDGRILGKPGSVVEAREFLQSLSGARHRVMTGVCLAKPGIGYRRVEHDETVVMVEPLQETDIAWYLTTGEWQGVAGAYRMQGAGAALLRGVEGSPSNVIGLPLRLVYSMLCACRFQFDRI